MQKNKKTLLNIFCQRIIKLPKNLIFKFTTIKIAKNTILCIENAFFSTKKYIILPSFFKLIIKKNHLFFSFLNIRKFQIIYLIFIFLLNNTNKIFYKQLIIKGSGFKINFISKLNRLDLKIGYTHKNYIFLPKSSFFYAIIQRPILIFLDINTVPLGNLVYKLKNIKNPNSYSGRGIWELKSKQKLKAIKKQ